MANLAQILFPPPTEQGLNEWMFHHVQHHRAIISAARASRGAVLAEQMIFPYSPRDKDNWLELHQDMHNDMNGLLGISGNDLSEVDFGNRKQREAWHSLHYFEHLAAATSLGLGT